MIYLVPCGLLIIVYSIILKEVRGGREGGRGGGSIHCVFSCNLKAKGEFHGNSFLTPDTLSRRWREYRKQGKMSSSQSVTVSLS